MRRQDRQNDRTARGPAASVPGTPSPPPPFSHSPSASSPAEARRNRLAILGFEFLWGVGLPFVQSTTTLPGYLKALGASGFLIGLVPALFLGGIGLVQPFSLYLIRPGPGRFRKMLWTYRIGAAFFLLMAASAILLPAGAHAGRVALFFALYAGFVFIAGAGDPHYVGFIVESITPEERGWFFGLRLVWFDVGALLGAYLASSVLHALPDPLNFGLSMACGGILIILSTLWFARFRPREAASAEARPSLRDCLLDIGRLAARRRVFLLFLLSACVFVLAQGPFTFLALAIKDRLHAGDAMLGQLSAVATACGLLFGLGMGYAGDRVGHRRTFLLGIGLLAVGFLGARWATSAPALFLSYFVAAACGPTWAVAAFNLGYECSGETDPARVYAGISLVTSPLRVLGPLAAGAGVDRGGYPPVFVAAALAAGVALILAFLLPHDRPLGEA